MSSSPHAVSVTEVQRTATVAVIIPVYNGQLFLRRAMESVFAQTHPATEILVVDDGSTDGTREIVTTEYAGKATLIEQKNGGPAKARNAALQVAQSEFIAFLDADDWWEPRKLEAQLEMMGRHPDTVMNYTGLHMVNEADGSSKDTLPLPIEKLWPALRWGNPAIPPASVMVRRWALEKVGGFNERQRGSEDWYLWYKLLEAGPFCLCNEPLTYYRVSSGGLSGDATLMFDDFMKMLDDTLLSGLSGLRRAIWRRRIISYQAFKACLTARAVGDKVKERSYMMKSVMTWPSPFWSPERFKYFAVTLMRT